jgi:hypothetical protein
VEEVAVGRVDLDPVETGLDRALRGGDESLSRFVEPLVVEWVRLGERSGPAVQLRHLSRRAVRRRRDGIVPVSIALCLCPGVHQLREDRAALLVDGVDDSLPGRRLLVGREAGLIEVALAVGGVRVDALGDEKREPAASEGGVVSGHSVGRVSRVGRARPRHRCETDAVVENVAAQFELVEERIVSHRVHVPPSET